jgi:hypothetical protein
MLRNEKKLSKTRATMEKNHNNREGSKDSEHYPLSNTTGGAKEKKAPLLVYGASKKTGK